MWSRLLLSASVSLVALAARPLVDATTCRTYDPARVSVARPTAGWFRSQTWKVESAGTVVEEAANQEDAEKVATLARFHNEECRIGPAKHLVPAVTFWKGAVKSLDLQFQEDCVAYDPSQLELNSHGYVRDVRPWPEPPTFPRPPRLHITVAGEVQGDAVLALARRATTACVIGGWYADSRVPASLLARPRGEQERRELDDIESAWHPVYYWK